MEPSQAQEPIEDEPIISSPRQEDFEAPRDDLQERFDEKTQEEDTSSAQGIAAPLIIPEEQEARNGEEDSMTAESSRRQETSGRGRGSRGGGRVASSGSARGRGGSTGKGAAKGGRGGGGAASASAGSRGGKQAKATTATKVGKNSGAKASTGSKSKDSVVGIKESAGAGTSSSNNIAAMGSGSGTGGGVGGASNTVFPLARVSRIVKVDKEIEMTSKDAIWTIAVATELFIKHLTDSAYTKARLDKKKKTVTFKELSSAVESQNEFFFLQDIIPQPISFSKALQMRQEVEERNHMREVGLFEDDDEDGDAADTDKDLDGASTTLINQTLTDDPNDSRVLKEQTTDIDEQGDVAMEEEQVRESYDRQGKRRGCNADETLIQPHTVMLNGTDGLSNGHASPESESEAIMS